MIKVVKADRYSHCDSCGKPNEYFCINGYTPDTVEVYRVKFLMDNSLYNPEQTKSFGLCKECLQELRKEMKRATKSEEVEESE